MAAWCLAGETVAQSPSSPALRVDHTLTPEALMAKASELSDAGHYDQALEWGKEALAAIDSLQGADNLTYAQCLSDLAGYHSHLGDYSTAIDLGTRALTLREKLAGAESAEYAQSQNNLARYLSYSGNYVEAVHLGRKAMILRANIFGKESAEYAASASNLAGYHSRLGNYDEALTLGQEALAIRERVLGKESADYAESLNNLSKYHYYLGHYDDAILLGSEALELRRRLFGEHHPAYATALSNIADYYMKLGNLPQAMRCGSMAMEIRREVLGDDHPEYAESVSNMASYHYALGHFDEAIDFGRQAMLLRRRLLGDDHLSYAHSMCKMAVYFSAKEQTDSANYYALNATSRYTANVMHTFADLTSTEREDFWLRVKPWFTKTLPHLAALHPTQEMVNAAYDGTLLAKGLLLNSELEMATLLLESSDSAMVGLFQSMQANRSLLIREFERPLSKRVINTDSLQNVITRQERRLVKRSKTYGNYTKSLVVGWRDVMRQLKPNEAAVEFISYQDPEGNECYGAFVLTHKKNSPVWVSLTDGRQISSIAPNKLYTTSLLTRLIWLPLSSYLKQIDRVYFSPAGELYNIGIESLPYWEDDGSIMSDHLSLYRLSSTRELTLPHGQHSSTLSAAVFGGITYDVAGLPTIPRKKKRAAKYLPGTKKEAEEIAGDFTASHIATSLYLGAEATETTFKQLSGNSPSVVHIATHGFYWTDSEVQKGSLSKKLGFLAMYDELEGADQALIRSGLLFAGANEALTGEEELLGYDDGVLTAKEISVLDLRHTDLLVLSACQTGLGKITGDGVFGLQRGLKKAGAKSLLMTLWKVDDVATRLLMSRFYSYLLQGLGKHESLRRAQHDLRTMDEADAGRRRHAISSRQKRAKKSAGKKIYDDPYYWAAFILLDGLD